MRHLGHAGRFQGLLVLDIVFLLIGGALFAIVTAYVAVCDRL